MNFLNETDLDETIRELADLVRKGSNLQDSTVDELAASRQIRADALRNRFLARYPDGRVPAALPTLEEAALAKSRAMAAAAVEDHRRFGKVYDQECILDGRRHTLICANKSRKFYLTFSHEELRVVQISYKAWDKMDKMQIS